MLYFWAIVFPPAVFFSVDKPGAGLVNLFIWLTCCSAPFAIGWAMWEASQALADQRAEKIADAIRESRHR